MIYIKIILRILLISCFFGKANTHDQIDFEPLQNIEKEKPNTSKTKLEYIFKFSLRCSALTSTIGKNTNNDKLILISRNFNQSAYISLLQIKKRNAEKLRQQVSEFIGAYIKIYDPIIKNNFSLNNSYIKGSVILEGDFQACKRFSPKTNNFLRQNGFQVLK